MWSFKRRSKDAAAEQAAPKPDARAFVVPNYTRGGPYVQANPVFADNPRVKSGTHEYETVSKQQTEFGPGGRATYPTAGLPPDKWTGYHTESWQRSRRDEHVLNAREGQLLVAQHREQWIPNPYRLAPNIVNRPQRQPHEYSFVRRFDKDVLGKRELTGAHDSQATIGQSSEPFKGMIAPMRRRSTYRLEPSQFTVATIEQGGYAATQMTFSSPAADYPSRSYRL